MLVVNDKYFLIPIYGAWLLKGEQGVQVELERSLGGYFDINYKWVPLPGLTMYINPLLFYTKIDDPMTLVANDNGFYEFQQYGGYVDTRGAEVNLKIKYGDFKLFNGYTHANVKQH